MPGADEVRPDGLREGPVTRALRFAQPERVPESRCAFATEGVRVRVLVLVRVIAGNWAPANPSAISTQGLCGPSFDGGRATKQPCR